MSGVIYLMRDKGRLVVMSERAPIRHAVEMVLDPGS